MSLKARTYIHNSYLHGDAFFMQADSDCVINDKEMSQVNQVTLEFIKRVIPEQDLHPI